MDENQEIMKKIIILCLFFVAANGYSKAVPSPTVFFNISEKILEGAHQFVFPDTKVTSKLQPKKDSKSKTQAVSKSQEALETLWNPLTIRRDGIWIVTQ